MRLLAHVEEIPFVEGVDRDVQALGERLGLDFAEEGRDPHVTSRDALVKARADEE